MAIAKEIRDPRTFRPIAVEVRMNETFWLDAVTEPEGFTIDAGYCLDAPKWLPTGSTRVYAQDFTIRPGFSRED